jgi:hypothetical protein
MHLRDKHGGSVDSLKSLKMNAIDGHDPGGDSRAT